MRESAEEQPVDRVAEFRQQSRSGRTAVDDAAARAGWIGIQRGAQRAGDLDDVRDRSRFGCADRPDGLVRHEDPAGGRALEVALELRDRRGGGVRTGEPVGLADAQHRGDAVPQRGCRLRGGVGVGLVEEASPLGMADLGELDPDLGELGGADLTGERAGVGGRDILRADRGRVCRRMPRPRAEAAGTWG